MDTNCLFCKIIRNEIPSKIVYRDDMVTAFWDIHPQTPVHILIVPNQHIAGAAELTPAHAEMLAAMFSAANTIAAQPGVAQSGYRLTINQGPDSGQAVFHLHLHLFGGKRMSDRRG